MNPVVHYYEQYNEDARLTTDHSRRLEYITTTHLLDKYIPIGSELLDLGAGTGIYSFYFAGKGCKVTSTDLTPKHVELIRAIIAQEGLTNIVAEPADATDLSSYADESFDAVLCLGPMYHLKDRAAQLNCLRECMRVLRPGGIVGIAYVNRLFIYPHLVRMDQRYLTREWMDRILDKGEISASDSDCFWTDAYFHLPEEMEALCGECGIIRLEHAATDGIGMYMRQTVNGFTPEEFALWVDYHLQTCTAPSTLGASNHGLYIGQKPL
ncbi:class I SAM-dependent methyltransferase [Paenibacillus mesotrionivorans]|uniref:Class I SAM-dependent methyltransferase n=1 Tax=Paenibacillus mesotrionivorans TaxID=3160968 RepID=A0ACC7P6I4_9BACL